MKEELLLTLNKQLANWNVLYVKLHNFHWNVSGNQFFTLHAKFEELFNEADIHIDTIAERVLSLRGLPVATMKSYLELTSVVEAHGSESSSEMVESTIRDFESILSELKLLEGHLQVTTNYCTKLGFCTYVYKQRFFNNPINCLRTKTLFLKGQEHCSIVVILPFLTTKKPLYHHITRFNGFKNLIFSHMLQLIFGVSFYPHQVCCL